MTPPTNDCEMAVSSNGVLIAATSVAILTLLPVAASQLGLIEHLPDPPGRLFDSDHITSSKQAHPLGVPDSFLAIATYSTTFTLAWLARTHPFVRRLLVAKLLADGAPASSNTVRQVVTFRKLCSWCTATALSTALMVIAGRKLIVQSANSFRDGRPLS